MDKPFNDACVAQEKSRFIWLGAQLLAQHRVDLFLKLVDYRGMQLTLPVNDQFKSWIKVLTQIAVSRYQLAWADFLMTRNGHWKPLSEKKALYSSSVAAFQQCRNYGAEARALLYMYEHARVEISLLELEQIEFRLQHYWTVEDKLTIQMMRISLLANQTPSESFIIVIQELVKLHMLESELGPPESNPGIAFYSALIDLIEEVLEPVKLIAVIDMLEICWTRVSPGLRRGWEFGVEIDKYLGPVLAGGGLCT